MIHLKQAEQSKSPQDQSPDKTESAEEGTLPVSCNNNTADTDRVPGEANTDINSDSNRSRSRRSSGSTPSKLSTPPSTPNSDSHVSPGSRTGGRSRSSSSGRKSITPPSGKGTKPSTRVKRPVRHGITWRESARIEARDFQEKWYPAKIVEIDDADRTVLIHFDGWNSRFDEWINMESDRLRPATRHSDRRGDKVTKPKSTSKSVGKADHKVGEHVFAKWSDCRMYPAKIMGINSNGTYDVLFYDGFRKSVQSINIRHMAPEVQEDYAKAGCLADPKKIKQNRAMFEKLAEKEKLANEEREKRKKALAGTSVDSEMDKEAAKKEEQNADSDIEQEMETSPKGEPKTKDTQQPKKASTKSASFEPVRTRSHVEDEDKKAGPSGGKVKGRNKDGSGKKRKLAIGGAFMAKKQQKLDKEARKEKKMKEKDVDKEKETDQEIVEETPKKPKAKKDREDSTEKKKSPKQKDAKSAEKPKVKRNKPKGLKGKVPPTEEVPTTSEPADEPNKTSVSEPDTPSIKCSEPETPVAKNDAGELPVLPTTPLVPPKAFLIEDDHNKYKCPFTDCPKAFRKKSLVDSHVKYYHTADGTPIQVIPPKKRRKTISVCSEDSEISVGGGRPSVVKSRKKTRDSTGSIPSTPNTPLETPTITSTPASAGSAASLAVSTPPTPIAPVKETAEATVEPALDDSTVPDNTSEVETRSTTTTTEGYEHHAEILHEESVDTAEDPDSPHDRLAKDEVVNCICQLNEENGLMIQCDVCLCWQHALCMDITEETLPKKYLCYVCLNPPGVRESARFSYDQDWLKQGTMARFNFLTEESNAPQKAQIMKATHELAGDMHNINMVLDSLRRKIHALKNRFHPEFRMWSKDWDKEVERQKEEESQAVDKQEPFENENSLISVDDDFSQIIGSEMLEQLARASLEILSAQKMSGNGDTASGLVGQAGFSLDGQAGLTGSTSGFSLDGSGGIGQLAGQGVDPTMSAPGVPGVPDPGLPSTSGIEQSLSNPEALVSSLTSDPTAALTASSSVASLACMDPVVSLAPSLPGTPLAAQVTPPIPENPKLDAEKTVGSTVQGENTAAEQVTTVGPVPVLADPSAAGPTTEAPSQEPFVAPTVSTAGVTPSVPESMDTSETPCTSGEQSSPTTTSAPQVASPPADTVAPKATVPPVSSDSSDAVPPNQSLQPTGTPPPVSASPPAAPNVSTPGPMATAPTPDFLSGAMGTDQSAPATVPAASDSLPSQLTPDSSGLTVPLPVDENSASFSLSSDKPVDLQLDTSATESCPEGEDPGVLPMDTSVPDDPVSEIMGSQDIAQALINPSMLDDVDPTKLLDDHPDDVSNSSTVTTEEDPKVICEQNLLEHILRQQDTVEGRLDIIEEQIQALESAEDGGNRTHTGETMRDLPRVKKYMHQLLNDLLKVKRMAMYH